MIVNSSRSSIQEMTKIAIVTALYVAVTVLLSVISFGPLQLRLSEMFNYLALFNRRYVIAVTLGVAIANFMSPTWVLDVPIGSIATLLALIISRLVTRNMENLKLRMIFTAIIFAFSMFTIAVQYYILLDYPFFYTWLTIAIGELFSMTIGGIIIYMVSKRIDLTK